MKILLLILALAPCLAFAETPRCQVDDNVVELNQTSSVEDLLVQTYTGEVKGFSVKLNLVDGRYDGTITRGAVEAKASLSENIFLSLSVQEKFLHVQCPAL